jgi:DMSO/TMAO reductase YedYZ molybdopterin-dependent catalytic subunit
MIPGKGWVGRGAALGFLLLAVGGAGTAVSAQAPAENGRVEVSGAVATPLSLSAADLKEMPRATADVAAPGAPPQIVEGVRLGTILERAGVPLGDRQWMAAYVTVEGEDGYRAVFSLGELDPGIGAAEVLVADTRAGAPLPATEGPFRLVVMSDRRAVRWLRGLKSITVARVSN